MRQRLSTESLARASAKRPWLTIGVWFVLLLVFGFFMTSFLDDALTTDADITTNPQSKQARKLIEERLRGPQRVNEIVIVQSQSATVDAPAFRSQVEGLYGEITALGPSVIASGTNYYLSGDESLVSDDRHITILPFAMTGSFEDADDNIGPVLDIVDSAEGEG